MKHHWSPKARATHRQPGLGKSPGSWSCYPEPEPPRCRAKERRRDQQLALTGHQPTPSPTPRGSRTAQPHNGTFGTTDSWIRERTDPLADVIFSSHLPFSQVGGGEITSAAEAPEVPREPGGEPVPHWASRLGAGGLARGARFTLCHAASPLSPAVPERLKHCRLQQCWDRRRKEEVKGQKVIFQIEEFYLMSCVIEKTRSRIAYGFWNSNTIHFSWKRLEIKHRIGIPLEKKSVCQLGLNVPNCLNSHYSLITGEINLSPEECSARAEIETRPPKFQEILEILVWTKAQIKTWTKTSELEVWRQLERELPGVRSQRYRSSLYSSRAHSGVQALALSGKLLKGSFHNRVS